eukprot:4253611-Amphidinium_carterae.6
MVGRIFGNLSRSQGTLSGPILRVLCPGVIVWVTRDVIDPPGKKVPSPGPRVAEDEDALAFASLLLFFCCSR